MIGHSRVVASIVGMEGCTDFAGGGGGGVASVATVFVGDVAIEQMLPITNNCSGIFCLVKCVQS